MSLRIEAVREIVRAALVEDLADGRDITSEAVVPAGVRAVGRFVAREEMVAAGLPLAREVFLLIDPEVAWEAVEDGSLVPAGSTLATVRGNARVILTGERTALNFLQRLCAVATLSRRAVREVEGTGTVILDTRKTTPGLRLLEKHAVAAEGAVNHRMGLHDAVLIKDNHVSLAGGVGHAIAAAAAAGIDPSSLTVEVDDLAGLEEALAAGAGRILLDNFEPPDVAVAVRRTAKRALIECSGGLKPGGLRAYAEAGADFLSLGCLTHSAPAVDISLEMERTP